MAEKRCDRILFKRNARVECIDYRRYETTASDHRPVSAGLRMTIKKVEGERMKRVRREVEKEWEKREGKILAELMEVV